MKRKDTPFPDDSVKKYTAETGGESFDVVISNDANVPASVSAGKRSLHFQIAAKSQLEHLSVVRGRSRKPVFIENTGGRVIVHLGCRTAPVSVKSERDVLLENFRIPAQSEETGLQIVSPLPGLVIKVLAQQGTVLKKDESIVIIEAMKMENEMRVPRDCTVREIHVREGMTIDTGQVIALLD